ncbi:MAG: hypothetical protein HWE30_13800 [Methylocystaceae bacterium]|nr:hypothetical protein [Methylocystaceae bacterium]
MSDKDGKKQKLKEFVEQLNSLSFPSSPISMELVEYVSESFRKYIDKEKRTLDQAFGLTGNRKKPRKKELHFQIAKIIHQSKKEKKTWKEILDLIPTDYGSGDTPDKRELQKLYKELKPEIETEEIVQAILCYFKSNDKKHDLD